MESTPLERIPWKSLTVLKYLYDHRGWHGSAEVARAVRSEDAAVVDALYHLKDEGFLALAGDASRSTGLGNLRARIEPSGVDRVRAWEECLGKE